MIFLVNPENNRILAIFSIPDILHNPRDFNIPYVTNISDNLDIHEKKNGAVSNSHKKTPPGVK